MNLKYSQIQIVVTSSKYCVKSRNESCVLFLSNCNTFIQSLQLKVFAGMEDLGHEVPQGSSGHREDGESLREEARPSLAPSLVSSKPCGAFSYSEHCRTSSYPIPPASHQTRTWKQKTNSCWYFSFFSFSSELPPSNTQLPIFQTFSLKLSAGLPSRMDPFCH